MTLEAIAPHGPFTTEIKFHFTNGVDNAEVSFDVPVGHIPDEDGIEILASKGLAAIHEAVGDDWRFQTRDEFVQQQLQEASGCTGVRFAVPEGDFSLDWAAGGRSDD